MKALQPPAPRNGAAGALIHLAPISWPWGGKRLWEKQAFFGAQKKEVLPISPISWLSRGGRKRPWGKQVHLGTQKKQVLPAPIS